MPQATDRYVHDDAVPGKNVDSVLFRVTLCHAADVARAGRFDEAESLLTALPSHDRDTADALDLLARIRAQQGRLGEAEALWERATQVEQHPRFDAELAKVRALKNRPWWKKNYWWLAAVLLGAATYLVAMMWTSIPPGQGGTVIRGPEVAQASIPAQPPVPAVGDALSVVRAPALPGVHVETEAKAIRFTFKNGIFTSGAEIRRDAYQELDEVAAMMRELSGVRQVVVTGLADAIPVRQGSPFQDNSLLGLARATEVVKYLSAHGGIPITSFLVATVGDRGATPGISNERDPTRRTVTLQVLLDPPERTGDR